MKVKMIILYKKKEAYHLGVSRESVFGEIGTLLQTVGNMLKALEVNTKSLVLRNDGQTEYLTSSIAHCMFLSCHVRF